MKITIRIDAVQFTAELNDSPTANAIAAALPLEGSANIWGEEIYFAIPVTIPLTDNAVEEVDVGTLAYWPTGNAFCIFFGPTPASIDDKPRAYSPVDIFGHILEDTAVLKGIEQGSSVTVSGDMKK
jgi:uncharacterized protein